MTSITNMIVMIEIVAGKIVVPFLSMHVEVGFILNSLLAVCLVIESLEQFCTHNLEFLNYIFHG